MPRKGTRQKLARGIYEDGSGRAGIVSIHGCPKELRFPPRTPLGTIRDKMAAYKRTHAGSGRARTHRGTLAHAVDQGEPLEQHLVSWRERRAELRAWVALYGDLRLTALTEHHIRRAIGTWTASGIKPKTIRNRLWSLKRLYALILGREAHTPVDSVEPPTVPRSVINPTSPAVILAVYVTLIAFEKCGRLRDPKTRARFMVRASTGRRPCEIMRAQPEDVDLERRLWRVRDAKGGWSEGLYLNDDMLTAWRVFAESGAWGYFNTGSMAEVLRAAGWPAHSRPYNLRHSVGIGLSESGVDLADVSGWLGHSRVQTTRSAYVPVLHSRMQRAAVAIEGRLRGWSVP